MNDSPKDIFRSTAPYYARYRVDYPVAFYDYVVQRFGLDGRGRLLDLGCGPGKLLLPLAPHFETAIGMDPEPEMLAEARRASDAAGLGNVELIEGGSNDLERLRDRLGELRFVAMGESFHWMDRHATLASLYTMLAPQGGLIISGANRTSAPVNSWLAETDAAIKAALGDRRRAGSGYYQAQPGHVEGDLLSAAGFRVEEIEAETSPYTVRRSRSIDDILGWLYTTSYASPFVLGDRREAFEADLRQRLLALSPDGAFEEEWAVGAFLAWKPA